MALPSIPPTRIEREAIYSDGAARLLLNVTEGVTARARRGGTLRYARVGRRILYLGSWLLAWIERASEPAPQPPDGASTPPEGPQ